MRPKWLVFVCSQALFFFILAQFGLCQPGTGNSGSAGGGSTAPSNLVVTASDINLPVGKEVTLTADHDQVTSPTYFWGRKCTLITGPSAAYHGPDWEKKQIKDCVGIVGKYEYSVQLNHQSPGIAYGTIAKKAVEFHAPNGATLSPELPDIFRPDEQGCFFTFPVEICLNWNGQALGPCAEICAQERVRMLILPEFKSKLGVWEHSRNGWWPAPCNATNTAPSYATNEFGNPWPSNTWEWQSPCLRDVQLKVATPEIWGYIQSLPSGTVIGKIDRQYKFSGTKCDGTAWKLVTEMLHWDVFVIQSPFFPFEHFVWVATGSNPVPIRP